MTVKQLLEALGAQPLDAIALVRRSDGVLVSVEQVKFEWARNDDPRLRRWTTQSGMTGGSTKSAVVIG